MTKVRARKRQSRLDLGRKVAPSVLRRRGPLTIDFHTHMVVPEVEALADVNPKAQARNFVSKRSARFQARQVKEIFEKNTKTGVRLKDMDAMGIDIQVISPLLTHYCYWAEPELGLRIACMCNDRVAEMVGEKPDRFIGLGSVPLQDVSASVKELERAMLRLKLKGVIISSRVEDIELGDPVLRPFWARAEKLGAVVYVHPSGFNHKDRFEKFFTWNSIGQPLEETIALASLIHEGVLDRFPKLKICFAHGGGYLPFYAGRMDRAFEARPETREHIDITPSAYLPRLYYDTVIYNQPQLEFLVRKVGFGRVVMGSDYPVFLAETDPVGFVRGAKGISKSAQEAILWRNAARLLDLRL
jgi:aminocarboxymuconate-semialdehyde decarboxylase